MCIFVHANSAAAVSIESIFATKRTICILCTSDVQCSREQISLILINVALVKVLRSNSVYSLVTTVFQMYLKYAFNYLEYFAICSLV